ncbi:unnamed protein product [Clavelina lepadiformis]|uniref:Uncharacterized protein n=1 Tax=Clavelina lepadiformis TaxID=159417 RepID=A0ABP0GT39_CLALP
MVHFLQSIARNLFRLLLPTRCIRRVGQRRNTKVFIFSLTLFSLALVMTRRNESLLTKDIVKSNVKEVLFTEKTEEIIPKALREVEEYDVKDDPPARHLMGLKNCSEYPSKLVGALNINPNITPSFDEVERVSGTQFLKGGCYTPANCKPLQKVAIIIPFKDREAHLKTLLFYLHPMLQKQMIQYCVYVAEQLDEGQFNKAMLMNAAFQEVMKRDFYDCIIFHDVDMIPENDKNLYMCGEQPRHLSPAIDKFEYKPHYGTDFGGVTGITPAQYRKANGHSNQFWGWGGEDNDMEFRIRYNKMKIIPSDLNIGRYKMIVHKHPWKFHPSEFPHRLNDTRVARAKSDGLKDLHYRLVNVDSHPTYTKLFIDIRRIEVKRIILYIDGKPAMDFDIKPGPCRWEKFEGKYLDFSIDLSTLKETSHLRSLRVNQPPPPPPGVDIKIPTTPENIRFSLMENFTEALEICQKIAPECQGVLQENEGDRYSLRRSNIPRYTVVSGPAQPQILQDKTLNVIPKKKYYFPKKTSFVRYCPGDSQYFQALKNPLKIDLEINQSVVQHTYGFDVHFSVLLQPADYLYYTDQKHFESQIAKGKSIYTFGWPKGKSPDFSLPDTPRQFTFRTEDFALPSIPGCYAVESKIQDRLGQPYYQWNWWFEAKSDDREQDAAVREAYWTRRMQEHAAKSMISQKKMEDTRKQALQAKREQQFQNEMRKIHKHELALQQKHLAEKGYVSKTDNSKVSEMHQSVQKLKTKENIVKKAPEEKSGHLYKDHIAGGKIRLLDPNKTLPPIVQVVPTHNMEEKRKPAVQRMYHMHMPDHLRKKMEEQKSQENL